MFISPKLLSMVLLLMLLLTNDVTSDPPFISKSPVENVMVSMLKIQQVKARILRGLNMTAAPHKSPTTRMLTPDSSKVKVKRPFDGVERQPNISMILSESADDGYLDTMTFKLDSRTRAHVQDIEVAILVVRLRTDHDQLKHDLLNQTKSVQELQNLSKIGSWTDRLRSYQTMLNTSEPVKGFENLLKNGPWERKQRRKNKRVVEHDTNYSAKSLLDNLEFHRNSTKYSSSHESKNSPTREVSKQIRGGKKRKMSRLKPTRVKVVIKVVDPETGKKRRIAVEKVSVKRTTTLAVPVSKDVLVTAAESSNHSLLLQMTCKRCQGRVEIEQVYKTVTRKNKKHRRRTRINPNRPYLFIRTGSSHASPQAGDTVSGPGNLDSPNQVIPSRSKRDSSSNVQIDHLPSRNITGKNVHSSASCCSQKIDVSFEDLGLNFVIYPKSLSVSYCMEPCPTDDTSQVTHSALYQQRERKLKEWYAVLAEGKLHCKSENIFKSEALANRSFALTHNSVLTMKTVPSSASSSVSRQCMLILVDHVNAVFLDDSNNVIVRDVAKVLYEFCDCNGRRLSPL